jgi:hypothetical protein
VEGTGVTREKRNGYEVGLDADGELDEVVVHVPRLVHLERMSMGDIWIGITLADGRTVHVDLSTKNGAHIRGVAEER